MTHVDASRVRSLHGALEPALAGEVRSDAYTRHLYSTDASMYAIEPVAVAYPHGVDDIIAATEIAREHEVPILPRGAGTSHCGQTVGAALVLDFSRFMHAIRDLDGDSRRAVVEPGVVQDDLNRAAAAHGLMFGADTSTSNRATLGGMIGNNSCGAKSARFGMTIDHVRAVDVVLADGSQTRLEPVSVEEAARRARSPGAPGRLYRDLPGLIDGCREAIARDMPPYWRRSGGYRLERVPDGDIIDLSTLICGSEGTLATVVSATVDLVPVPRATVAAVGHFTSVEQAVAATPAALESGADTAEMVDRFILDLARRSPEHRHLTDILEGEPEALLVCEFFGDTHAEAVARMHKLVGRWEADAGAYAVLGVDDAARRKALGQLRKAGLGLLMAAGEPGERSLAFVEDAAVGPEGLPEFTRRFAAVLQRHGLRAGFYGHASVGCLHVRPFMDLRQPDAVRRLRAVAEEIQALVDEYGGMNSSEHGDGLVRSEFNRRVFGDELYEAMRAVKHTFDPEGLMNPGKVVDAPPMTEHLREPSLPVATPVETAHDFGEGFRDAANRCMRIGACRKGPEAGGVMCPSYMATRDEQHSTRGRANALVKALSEPDPRGALGDERLHEILDLCLGCKACVSECPLSIDMAAMKSEALAHRYAVHGTPASARLLGRARALNRWGSATAPVSNVLPRLPGVRRLLHRVAGVDRRRPLPRFVRDDFVRWARRHRSPAGARGEVVLLADSFTSYTEPSIGRAAVWLLEQAGHTVTVATDVCCGRAQISKGLLAEGRAEAQKLVAALAGPARRGVPIVGCEPSCVAALRDEHPALLGRDDPDVRVVAEAAQLVEGVLAEAVHDGALPLRDGGADPPRPVLLHGHCHQKATLGTASTRTLLEALPGVEVHELEAGCCGMAGSFGYEHYDLSMKIAGMRLLPAVREAPESVQVVATGTSCRQQIAHGAGRGALHPVQLLERLVRGSP